MVALIPGWKKSVAGQRRNGGLLISGSKVRILVRPPLQSSTSYRSKRHAERGSCCALDHHVHTGWLAAGEGALDGAGQVGGALAVFAMSAESVDDLIVAERQ